MINVILNGVSGRMGHMMIDTIAGVEDFQVVAGIDVKEFGGDPGFPIFKSPEECDVKADVVIDFSHHSLAPAAIEYCLKNKTPLVLGATALDDAAVELLKKASEEVPMYRSANTSLGINLLIKAIKTVMGALEPDFNVEIIEKHHTAKLDSPSGTALLLADAVNDACETKKDYMYGRHGKTDECKMTDLGIHAVRGGTIPGEHIVMFAGPDEIIEFKHTALSRRIFATGAIKAARFLLTKENGLYNMEDVLG